MTQNQISVIRAYNSLEQWRKDRNLSIESQREGYLVNLLEELGEFVEAYRSNNKNQMIDALCDIFVFVLNAYPIDITRLSWTKSSIDSLHYHIGLLAVQSINLHSISSKSIFTKKVNEVYNSITNIADLLGYNFGKCMMETLKEISSRTGSYDERTKKWIKDTSLEAKAKWYKANYERCRI